MEEAIKTILNSGVTGALLVVCVIALFKLYQEVSRITAERISDYKEIIQKTNEAQAEQRTLLTQILDLVKALANGK
jgi:hypothetical protein